MFLTVDARRRNILCILYLYRLFFIEKSITAYQTLRVFVVGRGHVRSLQSYGPVEPLVARTRRVVE